MAFDAIKGHRCVLRTPEKRWRAEEAGLETSKWSCCTREKAQKAYLDRRKHLDRKQVFLQGPAKERGGAESARGGPQGSAQGHVRKEARSLA